MTLGTEGEEALATLVGEFSYQDMPSTTRAGRTDEPLEHLLGSVDSSG